MTNNRTNQLKNKSGGGDLPPKNRHFSEDQSYSRQYHIQIVETYQDN